MKVFKKLTVNYINFANWIRGLGSKSLIFFLLIKCRFFRDPSLIVWLNMRKKVFLTILFQFFLCVHILVICYCCFLLLSTNTLSLRIFLLFSCPGATDTVVWRLNIIL